MLAPPGTKKGLPKPNEKGEIWLTSDIDVTGAEMDEVERNGQKICANGYRIYVTGSVTLPLPLDTTRMLDRNQHLLTALRRGDLVMAIKDLDPNVVPVLKGTYGVVFEETDAYGDGGGPMVRWFTGYACNVYGGWVRVLERGEAREFEDDFDKLTEKVWNSPRVQARLKELAEICKKEE